MHTVILHTKKNYVLYLHVLYVYYNKVKLQINFIETHKLHRDTIPEEMYSKSLPDREKAYAKGRTAPLLPKLTPRHNRHYQTPQQSTSLLSLSSTDDSDDDEYDDASNRGNRVDI